MALIRLFRFTTINESSLWLHVETVAEFTSKIQVNVCAFCMCSIDLLIEFNFRQLNCVGPSGGINQVSSNHHCNH